MNAGMHVAGCWPSASMIRACVKPSLRSRVEPMQHRGALALISRQAQHTQAVVRMWRGGHAACALPSVLPSTTTQTGAQTARASRMVSRSFGPVL